MHYTNNFNSEIYSFIYGDNIIGVIMYGITGTWATALLAVITGYFAYMSGKKYKTVNYVIKRCCIFVLMTFFTLLITRALRLFNITPDIFQIIKESLFLSSKYYPQLWWIRHFFIGSILSFLNKKYKTNFIVIILEILFLYLFNYTWVAICLLGNLTYIFIVESDNSKKTNSLFIKIFVLALLIFFLRRDGDSKSVHLMWGLSASLLIILIQSSNSLKRLLSLKYLSRIGKNAMSIFLMHRNIYLFFGYKLFDVIVLPYAFKFFVVFSYYIY